MKSNFFSDTKYPGLVLGILIPIAETVRRWDQLGDLNHFLHWFDDYLFGGFMIFAALQAIKNKARGEKFLSAAWGMATSGMFLSFVAQVDHLDQNDPAPISSLSVAWIKGILLIIFIAFLMISLKDSSKRTN